MRYHLNHFQNALRLRGPLARFVAALAALLMLTVAPTPSDGAIVSRNVLKSFFQKGAKPTSEQFGTVIDSTLNLLDDRDLLGLKVSSDGGASLLPAGTIIGPAMDFGPAEGLSGDWAGQSGYLALAFTEQSETHYGFLEISSGDPGSSDLYPMFVTSFVYESTPNMPIVTASVPEPSTLVLGALCGGLGLCEVARRRRAASRIRR